MTASQKLRRIGLVNRGEPAMRFLRAVREYERSRGVSLTVVALYTDPDVHAPFVRYADEAVCLGPALQPGADGALTSAYVLHEHVINALLAAECDSVWPGWGFVSEDARFVEKLEREGIRFLGPSSGAIDRLGDKLASKRLAKSCGVPMAPWAEVDPSMSSEEVAAIAQQVGFPLMVKASAGGGGRGIRRVDSPEGLMDAVAGVRVEVDKVFGQGGVFVERCITDARHVEVQLVVGHDGRAVTLGVRDCSLQRRSQKVLEEAPSPVLPPLMEQRLRESSERLAESAGYQGVGTAEFLYVPSTSEACFLEVNSRLQVEHTVTEAITGCDLVHIQLDIAREVPWERAASVPGGWALEARLNAENPERGFQPSPGRIQAYRPPSGPGIRVDSGVEEGTVIAPEFDSMIAKVIAWAPTRDMAIARLERAIREFEVLVEDGCTNKAFLLEILQSEVFRRGAADTRWLDRAVAAGELARPDRSVEALFLAAVVSYNAEHNARVSKFFRQVHDGVPQDVPKPDGKTFELKLRGEHVSVSVFDLGNGDYLVGDPSQPHPVRVEAAGPNALTLTVDGNRFRALIDRGRSGIAVEIDGVQHTVERASGGVISAPAPAMVAHVSVEPGDAIQAGDPVCTLEAMKMETVLFSEESGVVERVLCRANAQVQAGQPLVILAVDEEGEGSGQIELPAPPSVPLSQVLTVSSMSELAFAGEDQVEEFARAFTRLTHSWALGFELPAILREHILTILSDEEGWSSFKRPMAWLPLLDVVSDFVSVERLFDRALLRLKDLPTALSAEMAFYEFCREHHGAEDEVREEFSERLTSGLAAYGVKSLSSSDGLREALWRATSGARHNGDRYGLIAAVLRVLLGLHDAGLELPDRKFLTTLEQLALVAGTDHPAVADGARQLGYSLFRRPHYLSGRGDVRALITDLSTREGKAEARELEMIRSTNHDVLATILSSPPSLNLVEAALARLYPEEPWTVEACELSGEGSLVRAVSQGNGRVFAALVPYANATALFDAVSGQDLGEGDLLEILWTDGPPGPLLVSAGEGCVASQVWAQEGGLRHQTFVRAGEKWSVSGIPGVHHDAVRRLNLERYEAFTLTPIASSEKLHAFLAMAKENARDERVIIHAEVLELPEAITENTSPAALHAFEGAWFEALRLVREIQSRRGRRQRFQWNRLTFHLGRPMEASVSALASIANALEPHTRGLGLELVNVEVPLQVDGQVVRRVFEVRRPAGHRVEVGLAEPNRSVLEPVDDYATRVVRCRRLGLPYPYEVIRSICGDPSDGRLPHPHMVGGVFEEWDFSADGVFQPVQRRPGLNQAGVVVGVITNQTPKVPEGMSRVWIASDPTRAMGALSEPECRRVIAALELASRRGLPLEWIAISAGAKIAMDSGTENLDWTARVLREIVRFTEAGGEIHVIVPAVNVGAQSYWNAEATMLMHTKGVLIMTAEGSMVLTGKRALEISGGVAAEDEKGIGGFERIMGPNGQAQYFTKDLGEAYQLLFRYYEVAYRVPGESLPRRYPTTDVDGRDVCLYPYTGPESDGFTTIGEIFDPEINAGRKRPFDIRALMSAVKDTDAGHLERFRPMRAAETSVVWDTHIGGHGVSLIGIESRPIRRAGRIPLDGPDIWAGGTLFPQSSKKVARALNAASGVRPAVVLANLSGFDGSPESLRNLQLEYGAEIGRAVVNFQGPIIFVVVGRYHGGAYVVFSKALNPSLKALAVEGSFASVIGGAPAAAVVFPREVRRQVQADPRVIAQQKKVSEAGPAERITLQQTLDELMEEVMLEKRGEVAAAFDGIHTVQRAVEVGSLDAVITAGQLRPAIIGALTKA